ncbi:MAG: response regulator [bacterium]
MSHPSGPRHTPVTPLFLNLGGEATRPRVLVIDDEEEVRTAIASLLRRRGCDAVAVESGTIALERLHEEYFDVLLCDVRMPGMSGLEFLSEALRLDRDLPVLMLSGLNDLSTARDALERGAMDYLTKPIELDELDRTVRAATRHRRHEIEKLRAQRERGETAAPVDSIELRGGPLAGRKVNLADRRLRLWVATQADGQHVYASIDTPPHDRGVDMRLLGFYGYSSRTQAMMWSAQESDETP